MRPTKSLTQSTIKITSTFSGDKFIGQLEKVIEKAKKRKKIKLDNTLLDIVPESHEILDFKFQLKQKKK